jgi:hypothetical protein
MIKVREFRLGGPYWLHAPKRDKKRILGKETRCTEMILKQVLSQY